MKDVGFYILAGGKSSRMGRDKGFIKYNEKPLVQHVIDAILPISDNINIVANDSAYAFLKLKVHPDLIGDIGPVGGIYTVLKKSPYPYNFILSCDMPLIRTNTIKYILNQHQNHLITIPVVKQQEQPLCAVYNSSILNNWHDWMKNGERRLLRMVKHFHPNLLDMKKYSRSTIKEFKSFNTKEDLKYLK